MFKILTASVLCSAIMRHHSKFCADWSNRYGYMAVFQFFKMTAVRHLRFLKVGNFNCPYPLGAKMHYSAKFCANRSTVPGTIPNFVQIGRTVERYGRFSIFQDGGRPPSWIYQKWPTQREPILAPSRNWYLMVISNSDPKMVLVEQFEQSRCFRRLSPLTRWKICPLSGDVNWKLVLR